MSAVVIQFISGERISGLARRQRKRERERERERKERKKEGCLKDASKFGCSRPPSSSFLVGLLFLPPCSCLVSWGRWEGGGELRFHKQVSFFPSFFVLILHLPRRERERKEGGGKGASRMKSILRELFHHSPLLSLSLSLSLFPPFSFHSFLMI